MYDYFSLREFFPYVVLAVIFFFPSKLFWPLKGNTAQTFFEHLCLLNTLSASHGLLYLILTTTL